MMNIDVATEVALQASRNRSVSSYSTGKSTTSTNRMDVSGSSKKSSASTTTTVTNTSLSSTGSSLRTMADNNGDKSDKGQKWMGWVENCGVDLFSYTNGNCDARVSSGDSAGQPVLQGSSPQPHLLGSKQFLLQEASGLLSSTSSPLTYSHYEALHDEFLESLLYEQTLLKRTQRDEAKNRAMLDEDERAVLSSSPEDSDTSLVHPHRKRRRPVQLHKHRRHNSHGSNSSGSSSGHRQHRKLRISKVAPSSPGPLSPPASKSGSTVTVSFAELARNAELRDPAGYMHPHCRMQKDKGKGEPVGSSICAKGRDACLLKLRVKMELLTEVAMPKESGNSVPSSSKKGPVVGVAGASATMKRRKAKVSRRHANFVETRSLIELRMGFLSMTYGVLLRWDTGNQPIVTLVVLRKMCHESFYPKISKNQEVIPGTDSVSGLVKSPILAQSQKSGSDLTDQRLSHLSPPASPKSVMSVPSAVAVTGSRTALKNPSTQSKLTGSSPKQRRKQYQFVQGNNTGLKDSFFDTVEDDGLQEHAFLQRPDGTEVTLFEPPYRVARPETFAPARLSVAVVHATGLNKRSSWTVQLHCYFDRICSGSAGKVQIHTVLLAWDSLQGCMVPRSLESAQQAFTHNESSTAKTVAEPVEVSRLELKLFEHLLKRKNQRRLMCDISVPLERLQPEPLQLTGSASSKYTRVRLPCHQPDSEACVVLDLLWQSEYGVWIRKELAARRRDEVMFIQSSGEEPQASSCGEAFWRVPFDLLDGNMQGPGNGKSRRSGDGKGCTGDGMRGKQAQTPTSIEVDEAENGDAWDWICHVC